MSSPIITLTSSSSADISRTLPYRNNTIFRDPSFSSYLNGAEENFLVKLRSTTSIAIPHNRILPGEHRTEDAEIDVFDAEKYFSQSYAPDISVLQSQQLKNNDEDAISVVREQQPRIAATQSSRSESSSNISQTALLHSLLRNQQHRRGRRKNFLPAIGCSCSCRDKNSVSIDNLNVKKCSGNGSGQRDKHIEDSANNSVLDIKFDEQEMRGDSEVHFSFPVFNPKIGNQDDAPRQKPFQALDKGKYRFINPAGKLNQAAWNSIPAGTGRAATVTIPSVSTEISDGCDSDASSDLFEIESLSMQESSDGCVTPRAGYAPSEASIEWSVVTASAADFSALSDTDEVRSNAVLSTTHQPQKPEANPKTPRRRSGILSGCRNHKAVNVAGSYVDKAFSSANGRGRRPLTPVVTRFPHNEGKDRMPGFKSRSRHCVLSKPHHGTAPHLLYT